MVAVVRLSTIAPSSPLRVGQTISFALALSGPVVIDTAQGVPTLSLSNGVAAAFDAARSDPVTMAFTYTVGWGEDSFDLVATGLNAADGAITSAADGSKLDLSTFHSADGLDTALRIDTGPPSAPEITSLMQLANEVSQRVTGTGLPGSQIELIDNAITPVATATVGGDGRWAAAVQLSPGAHALTAAQTDAFGLRSVVSDPVVYGVDEAMSAQLDLAFTDVTNGVTGAALSTPYSGPLDYLEHQYLWTGSGSVALSSALPNAFLHGGTADDAIMVTSGSNVLDGGAGSNFLVGALGTDGGSDTFFTDARGGDVTWSTIIHFHTDDYATLWGFDPNVTSWHWEGISGVAGFTGATLRADVHGTGVVDASMTFADLTMEQAQSLQWTTGSVGGNGFLLFHNQGV